MGEVSLKSVLFPLLVLAPPAAFASTGSVSLVDGNHLAFFFNDNLTFSTTTSASGAASDATYTASVSATTLNGALEPSRLHDAFDGYNSLVVNSTSYNGNGVSSLECGDRQLVFATQTVGSLEVSRKVFVPADAGFARWMNVVRNVGSGTETVVVRIPSELGSDDMTAIMATSSGDRTVSTADAWAVTMEALGASAVPGDVSTDPRLAHVWQNNLGAVKADTANLADGDDTPVWTYTFDLPAGQTAILLSFVSGAPTWADARAAAQSLVDLPVPTTACLTVEEWDDVVNFGVDCAGLADACTESAFDVLSGVCVKVASNEGGSCDDGTDCTVDDMCTLGSCDGDPAPEDIGAEVDANCDATVKCYVDGDGDGFRTDETVTSDDVDCADAGEATVDAPTGDCDDANATSSPDGVELAGDGIDQDCSGADQEKKGCGCDTRAAPQGSLLAMLIGATVMLRRKARRA